MHSQNGKAVDSVAQLVEHLTFNQRVLGSSPNGITGLFKSRCFVVASVSNRTSVKSIAGHHRPPSRDYYFRNHFEAKSRATVSYPTPSDPEGSSGQYRCRVIRISLASFFFYTQQQHHAAAISMVT